MGRQKADTADKFPWDKYFSGVQSQYEDAIEYCTAVRTSADTVRKAVIVLGISDTTGTKADNCLKMSKEINGLNMRLNKIVDSSEREQKRIQLISHLRNSLITKADKIIVQIPEKPDLPRLTQEEKEELNSRFPGVLSVMPKKDKSPVLKGAMAPQNLNVEEAIVDMDFLSLNKKPKEELNEQLLLESNLVLYYHNAPFVNGKRQLSVSEALKQLTGKYQGKVKDDSILLNIDNVRALLQELIRRLANKDILNEQVLIAKKNVEKYDKMINVSESRKEPTTLPGVQPTPIITIKPVAPPLPPKPQVKVSVVEPQIQIPRIEKKGKYDSNDFIEYMRMKGWDVPESTEKMDLCDYLLEKIRKEEKSSVKQETILAEQISKLSDRLAKFYEMYEEDKKAAKEAEVSKKIKETKKKIDVINKESQSIEEDRERRKEVCFIMNNWIDQDEFDEKEAIMSMYCSDETTSCDLDNKVCVDRKEAKPTLTKGFDMIDDNISVYGSLDLINKVREKLANKRKKVVTPPVVVLPTPPPKLPPPRPVIKPTKKIVTEEPIIVKPIVTEEPIIQEPIEVPFIEEPEPVIRPNIIIEDEPVAKKCFVNSANYTSEADIYNDLKCGDGEVCNLETQQCEVVEEGDIVETIRINNMFINVKGASNIMNVLKTKIQNIIEQNIEEEPEIREPELRPAVFESKKTSFEDILSKVKGMKGASQGKGGKASDQRLKKTMSEAAKRLRECAGLK